ncbi:hypothetical protein FEI13_03960 [Halomonas urmiana]|uniref:Uncharacterized protein n=1 Tax=Halomonas urmiana TaxID=490901 RepID=A0A5R8ML34_9GAMM|nr:hypothetical protein [Halomonas urmiana]TLF52866.1 hypothetical protein FEI13_03960 [Halomonas urmiana]
MTRIVLHVDRLVLRGVAPGDAAALGEALRAELGRRLAQPGALDALRAANGQHRLDAGRLRLAPERGTAALGKAVARRIIPGGEP